MNSARLLGLTGAVIAGLFAASAPAQAAPLAAPFATVNVNCPSGTAQAAPLTSDHPRVVARISGDTTMGSLWAANDSVFNGKTAYAGDQLFGNPFSMATNDSPRAVINCGTGGAQISFYDVPTAPTSYPESVQDFRSSAEDLPFVVPSAARFVADVQLTQGAVTVADAQLASSGTVALGALSTGDGSVHVSSLDGPPAHYTVTVRPLPIAVSGLTVPSAMRAGAPQTLTYNTDGSTTATVTLADATGVVGKTIAVYAVSSGSHALTFDGHADNGQLLPDGTYTAVVASSDPYGTSTQQTAPVRIDGTPPQITVTPPVTPLSPIQVSATDASGVTSLSADTSAHFYDQSSSYLTTGPVTKTTTIDPPSAGWSAGSMVQIDVSAQDAVGNKALRSTRAVLIPGGRPPLAPTASAPPSPLASSPARQKRATVARRGLLVSGTGSGAVRVSVRVSAALARSLGATSRTIAVRNVTGLGGHFRELVKFGSRVRRAIRHRSRTTVTVSVSGGATATKTIAIVR